MSLKELKLDMIQTLLQIQDAEQLKKLERFMKKTFEKKNTAVKDDYIHPKGISFDEWNKQFNDVEKLDEIQPEYGISLMELRRKIWEAEQSEEHTYEQYIEKTKHWFK